MSKLIAWAPNGTTLVYNGQEIALSTFRELAHGLVADMECIMREKLLFISKIPNLPLDQIMDFDVLANNHDVGYSFVNDSRNSSILGSSGLTKLATRKSSITAEEMTQYIKSINDFLELLLIAFLITGGQPPYGIDLLYLFLRNEKYPCVRSIYLQNMQICLMTADPVKMKPILRFLPAPVTSLVVLYMTDVLPYLRSHGRSFKDPLRHSNFLFPEGNACGKVCLSRIHLYSRMSPWLSVLQI